MSLQLCMHWQLGSSFITAYRLKNALCGITLEVLMMSIHLKRLSAYHSFEFYHFVLVLSLSRR